ncbi:MAG: hypothetical protein HY336_00260 [Candidatus Doudnabacteria bacterium]|nr:hypothetical protein [Candidatus Doudnabacteria bacterium]
MHRPFRALAGQRFESGSDSQPEAKKSQRPLDVFSRELLESNPEVKLSIESVMAFLAESGLELPAIHITSGEIRTPEGTVPTGFLKNIHTFGLKRRQSNLAVFIKRKPYEEIAGPEFFRANPEEFIKDLYLILKRYAYHGLRTNKDALGEKKNAGNGAPVMLLVEGPLKLDKGSDYDDHYIAKDPIKPGKIFGDLELDKYSPYREHFSELLIDFLKLIEFYSRKKESVA